LLVLLPAVVIVVRNCRHHSSRCGVRPVSVDQADLVVGHPVDADTRRIAYALALTVVDSRRSLDARTAADTSVLIRRPTNL